MSKTFITCKILNRKWYIVQILLILIKYMKALSSLKWRAATINLKRKNNNINL